MPSCIEKTDRGNDEESTQAYVYVAYLKGVGKIYQQSVIGTYMYTRPRCP
jgi:hypothetical protein